MLVLRCQSCPQQEKDNPNEVYGRYFSNLLYDAVNIRGSRNHRMPARNDPGNAEAGRTGECGYMSPEEENAALRAETEFLKKKLNLVGSVTRHDVLNQMTAIVGYNELLEMVITDEKQKSYIEREKVAVDKIRRLFQFAKDYQNIAVEPPRWQSLDNSIRRAMEAFDNPAVRVTVSVGRTAVLADSLLDKAFLQFFDNAARHGGTATELRVSFEDLGTHGQVTVEDNGAGIPVADKDRVFERGYGRGTGWGLFLAREILAITGFTVIENGEPGKGARFVITLPKGTYREGDGGTPLPA